MRWRTKLTETPEPMPEPTLPHGSAAQKFWLSSLAKARGLKIELYGPADDWREQGLEFRDRLGHYACLRCLDIADEPRDWVFEQLAELGLNVRTNKELAPDKRQLRFSL